MSGIHKGIYPLNFDGSPYKNLLIRFEPQVIVQYDNTFDGNNILAFSGKQVSFRTGPQLGLFLEPFNGIEAFNLNLLTIKTFWHGYHEFAGPRINYVANVGNYGFNVYGSRNAYVFQTNLNYKLSSNIGLTLGYQRGVDENAGKSVNLFKIGLAGQLCGGCK